MLRKLTSGLCVFAFTLTLSCSPKITKLEIVRIGNIRLESVSKEILSLRAQLVLRNPYSTSAELKNITFDLALADQFIGYGKLAGPVELKGDSTATVDVPIALNCNQVTQEDFAALLSEKIPYRLKGSAVLEKPFGPRTIPIDVKSSVDAPSRLVVYLKHRSSLSIVSLDATRMEDLLSRIKQRKVQVRFRNPFSFPLTIRDFQYEARLGKSVVAAGKTESPLVLQPGDNRFAVGVNPRFLGAAEAILKGLMDRQAPDLALSSHFHFVHETRSLEIQLIYPPD